MHSIVTRDSIFGDLNEETIEQEKEGESLHLKESVEKKKEGESLHLGKQSNEMVCIDFI